MTTWPKNSDSRPTFGTIGVAVKYLRVQTKFLGFAEMCLISFPPFFYLLRKQLEMKITITFKTITTISFNTETWEAGNGWDGSQQYEIQASAIYDVEAMVTIQSLDDNTSAFLMIYVDGVEKARGELFRNDSGGALLSVPLLVSRQGLYLAADEVVDIRIYWDGPSGSITLESGLPLDSTLI